MADIYSLMKEMITSLGENNTAQRDIINQQQDIANQSVEALKGVSTDALAVKGQQLQGDLQAQTEARNIRNNLGNNPNDPNSLLSILVQDFRENTIAAREQAAQIAAKKQVGIFDDLPQFLINQVTLPDDINAYNGTMGKVNAAKDGIAAMQSLTTASAQAMKATAENLTKDSVAAQLKVSAVELDNKIRTLQADSLGYDLQALKLTEHANAQHLQWAMAEHSMRLQDAAAARASEEWKWKMDQKKEAEAEGSRYAEIVSLGAKAFGLPSMGLEEIKSRVKFGTAAQKMQMDKLYEQGLGVLSTGSSAIGATPGEAIINAVSVGGLKDAQNKPTRDFLDGVRSQVIREMNLPANTKDTPELRRQIAENINEKLYGKVIDPKTGKRSERTGLLYQMASDVEAPGSIFKAPDLPALVAVPSIKNNILFKDVIAPAAGAGVTKSDPETLLSLALEAEKRGVVNRNQIAQGISDFYKSAGAVAYAASGASKFALPYRPSYVAGVTSSTPFASKEYWDFSKPESVLTYVTLMEARQRLGNSPMQYDPPAGPTPSMPDLGKADPNYMRTHSSQDRTSIDYRARGAKE